jgi:hypothetical protein
MPRAFNRPAYLKTQANIFRTQSASSIDRTFKKDYKKDFYYNCSEHGHIAKFCTITKKKVKKIDSSITCVLVVIDRNPEKIRDTRRMIVNMILRIS